MNTEAAISALLRAAAKAHGHADAATPSPWWLHAEGGGLWAGDQGMTRDLDRRSAAGELIAEREWEAWDATRTGALFHGDAVHTPDGEHIAAADPAFIRTIADWWETIARLMQSGDPGGPLLIDLALHAALTYLRESPERLG